MVCDTDFKKIRAVWQSKAEHGECIPSVPYGYKKSEDNPKQWVIDQSADDAVRKIYALCLAGRGSSQIARQLEEKILLPTAYYESIGRKIGRKSPHNLFSWDQKTVVNIEGAKYHLQAKRRTPSYSRYAGDNHL